MGEQAASALRDPSPESDPISDLGATVSCERAADQPGARWRSRRDALRAARLYQPRPAHVPASGLPDDFRTRPGRQPSQASSAPRRRDLLLTRPHQPAVGRPQLHWPRNQQRLRQRRQVADDLSGAQRQDCDGETVHAGAGVRITEVCGLYLSSFGLPARYTPLAPAPGAPATATVRVQFPASVHPGAVLHYTITLSNPTKTPITLQPCPGYSEGIYASGLVIRRSFALNCDAVHAIGADEHVRYAMELAVPSRAAAGVAKFSWGLNDPNGPFAGRIIRISRR